MDRLIEYFDSLKSVGDALVGSLGTIVAAVLGALVGVLTYIASARREAAEARKERHEQWLAEEARRAHELAEERRLREERIDDFVRALHAEIITGIVFYEDRVPLEEVRRTLFTAAPFATPDDTDFVFDIVRPELTILPSKVIHSVVSYYRAQKQTNLIISDFRGEEFQRKPVEARAKFMEGYVEMLFVLRPRGEEAVRQLEAWADERGYGEELRLAGDRLREGTRHALAWAAKTVAEAKAMGPPTAEGHLGESDSRLNEL